MPFTAIGVLSSYLLQLHPVTKDKGAFGKSQGQGELACRGVANPHDQPVANANASDDER
jgi:hypothetical protein